MDASQNIYKTSIAVVNIIENTSSAYLIHNLNSIFTAKVLVLNLGIQCFLIHSNNYIILLGSKSALEALKHIDYKSPDIILHLFQILRKVHNNVGKITLI